MIVVSSSKAPGIDRVVRCEVSDVAEVIDMDLPRGWPGRSFPGNMVAKDASRISVTVAGVLVGCGLMAAAILVVFVNNPS
jgi:hypothetical protein